MRNTAPQTIPTRALGAILSLLLVPLVACGDDTSSSAGAGGSTMFPSAGGSLAPAGGTGGLAATPSTAGNTTPVATAGVGAAAAGASPAAGAAAAGAAVNPSACPGAAPAAGTACDAMGFIQCEYATGTCQCFDGSWMCGGGATTDPGTNPDGCPMRPDNGGACTTEGATCSYRRNDCVCTSAQWSCDGFEFNGDGGPGGFSMMDGGPGGFGDPTDGGINGGGECPAAEPADDSPCDVAGTTCDYGGTSCGCYGGAWRC